MCNRTDPHPLGECADYARSEAMTVEFVDRSIEDATRCICGNEPHLDGFYVSDKIGTTWEGPTGPLDAWDGDTMACYSCGRTFSLATGEVFGRASDEMLRGARLPVWQ